MPCGLQEALDRIMTGRTSVVVAHRLSTIRNANSIAVVYRCVRRCAVSTGVSCRLCVVLKPVAVHLGGPVHVLSLNQKGGDMHTRTKGNLSLVLVCCQLGQVVHVTPEAVQLCCACAP